MARGRTALLVSLAAVSLASAPLAAAEGAQHRVAALGRLEPGEGVLDVAAPRGERVESMQVGEGAAVAAGDVLATLDSHAERLAARDAWRARADAEARALDRIREVGPLDLVASEADVRRLEAALAVEQADLKRLAALLAESLVPPRDHEQQAAKVARASEELNHGRALFDRQRASLKVEEAEAKARLAEARAELAGAEARLERSLVRAPVNGQVLSIITWAGETVVDDPILRLGETGRMYAVAEVYETDARFVRLGQTATITSPALPSAIRGTVERISPMVHKNDVLGVDPAAATDARVVEVRVRLAEGADAARFIHLQVDVEIATGSGPGQ